MPKKNKSIVFHMQISQLDKDKLQQLAKDRNVTMSEICRASISHQFRMRFANEPKCSNGNNCLCPNMHTLNGTSGPSDAELLNAIPDTNGKA